MRLSASVTLLTYARSCLLRASLRTRHRLPCAACWRPSPGSSCPTWPPPWLPDLGWAAVMTSVIYSMLYLDIAMFVAAVKADQGLSRSVRGLFTRAHPALTNSPLSARYSIQRSPNRKSVSIAVDSAAIRLSEKVSHRTAEPPVPERLRPTSDGTMIAELIAVSRKL